MRAHTQHNALLTLSWVWPLLCICATAALLWYSSDHSFSAAAAAIAAIFCCISAIISRYYYMHAATFTTTDDTLNIERQAFLDASGDGYWDWHIQDDYEYMSPNFWNMFGFSPDEKRHHPSEWQSLIFPDDLPLVLENFNQHVASKGTYPFMQDVRYHHKDGSTVVVRCSGAIIEWDDKDMPVRMIGTHTDITALKSTEKFNALVKEATRDLMFVKDEEFRIVDANSAFLSVYPTDIRDQVIGSTTFEKYNEQECEEFLEYDKIAFRDGTSEVTETIQFPDGKTRIIYTTKTRFEDAENNRFILGISRDVTQQETLIRELEASNRELDEFAYITSHDLKEPLRGIQNHIVLLRRQNADILNEDINTRLDRVTYLTEHMSVLISDLLYYSRLGRTEEAYRNTDMNILFADIKKATLATDDTVNITIDDDMPTFHCDRERIREVFRNLVINGIKYNDRTDKHIHIGTTREHTKVDEITFYVKDNGIGINEKYHDVIFRIFKRLHRRDQYGGGSGAGLTFVRRIVEQHDGHIRISSTPNNGSIFYITLPKETAS